MEIKDVTIERAVLMAKKSGDVLNEENALGYFTAALAEEMKLIEDILNTAKKQQATKRISGIMARRMYYKCC